MITNHECDSVSLACLYQFWNKRVCLDAKNLSSNFRLNDFFKYSKT